MRPLWYWFIMNTPADSLCHWTFDSIPIYCPLESREKKGKSVDASIIKSSRFTVKNRGKSSELSSSMLIARVNYFSICSSWSISLISLYKYLLNSSSASISLSTSISNYWIFYSLSYLTLTNSAVKCDLKSTKKRLTSLTSTGLADTKSIFKLEGWQMKSGGTLKSWFLASGFCCLNVLINSWYL